MDLSPDTPLSGNFFWFCDICIISLKHNKILSNNLTVETCKPQETHFLSTKQDSCINTITDNTLPVIEDTITPLAKPDERLNNIVYDFGTQISYLTFDCQNLRRQLDSIEAHSKKRNIEITGIPYRSSEKIEDIFVRICDLLGIAAGLNNVDRIYRIKPRDNNNSRKSIIVEFKEQSTRDIFISTAKLCKKLLLANLGFEASTLRFFVNEHPTGLKKHILYQLKHSKQNIQYDRLWVSKGQIYVRFPDRVVNVSSREILNGLINNHK